MGDIDTRNQSGFLFDPPRSTRKFLTVTELTNRVKGALESSIGEVWIKGEISGFKPSAAGHFYFNLKDAGAVLGCALFRRSAPKFEVHDGLEVLAHGRISVYPPRGSYQLIIDFLEPVGHGALQLAFEQLKEKLQKEGLFEAARKRVLPPHPSRVAIVTSPTGAALQDFLNILGRRNAGISVLVVPTLVQGEEAPEKIARAIQVVNAHKLADVLVVARGGGSLEDLWAFNDERVVRAVAGSKIPTISAVGHEVDFTLCDFAADLRAPTPSAAAELVSRSRLELLDQLTSSHKRLVLATSSRVNRAKSSLLAWEAKLISPAERLTRARKRVDEIGLRMAHAVESRLPVLRQLVDDSSHRISQSCERLVSARRRQFEGLSNRLEALSPLKVLGRGYTLVQDPATGTLLKSVHEATAGREVALVFQDGKAQARIVQ